MFDSLRKSLATPVEQLSPLVLAYVGDAVFELYVRTKVLHEPERPIHQLHQHTTTWVRAEAQAEWVRVLEPHLTEDEMRIVKRGRNAKGHAFRRAGVQAYRYSTGFEALLGHLFLQGKDERLVEILGLLESP